MNKKLTKLWSVGALVLIVTGCGTEKSYLGLALDAYTAGPLRSECATLPFYDQQDFRYGSFIEIHDFRFYPDPNPINKANSELSGTVERVLYDDLNCGKAMATLRYQNPNPVRARPKPERKGFFLTVPPPDRMVVLDESICQRMVLDFKMAKNMEVAEEARRECRVGSEIDLTQSDLIPYVVAPSPDRKQSQLVYVVRFDPSHVPNDPAALGPLVVSNPMQYNSAVASERYNELFTFGVPNKGINYRLFPQSIKAD